MTASLGAQPAVGVGAPGLLLVGGAAGELVEIVGVGVGIGVAVGMVLADEDDDGGRESVLLGAHPAIAKPSVSSAAVETNHVLTRRVRAVLSSGFFITSSLRHGVSSRRHCWITIRLSSVADWDNLLRL